MNIEDWWPHLEPATRQWLIDHNGEPVPSWAADEIVNAARLSMGADDAEDANPLTVELTDADIDWIEAAANDEE